MITTTTRQVSPGPMPSMVRDDHGQVWQHDNPAELYRWIAARNDLIRTIAAVTRPSTDRVH